MVLSLHAQRALERLNESNVLNWSIRGDAASNDANCSGDLPNLRFNTSLEYYLGSQQVIHAADSLNSYCQSILGEIAHHSDQAWSKVESVLKQKKPRDKVVEQLKAHRGPDGWVRETLSDEL